jgi:hypothetical protein
MNEKEINEVFIDCLFRDDENTCDPVMAPGWKFIFGFHKDRLRAHQADVDAGITQLKADLHAGQGSLEWSFETLEQIIVLARALKGLESPLPSITCGGLI